MRSLAVASSLLVLVQTPAPQPPEQVSFFLHKMQQRIGVEHSIVTRGPDGIDIRTTFGFTDRGTTVPLAALLQLDRDGTPRRLEVWGRTSRFSRVDDRVVVTGQTLRIEQAGVVKEQKVPDGFFVSSGYAPAIVIQELLRHWQSHGRPAELPVLPLGPVKVQARGRETLRRDDGTTADADRWSISGLGWGRTTAWTDARGGLIGLKTVDAEYDHFEAVRLGWSAALKAMVASAASDGMAELAESSTVLPLNNDRQLALVGGTVIDASGRPPLKNATVLVDGDRIRGVGPTATVPVPAGTQAVDVTGKTILPGLWDMHAHVEQVEWGPVYLAAGVTTVRDNGNELEFIRSMRDTVDAGKGLGPRILLACIVDGRGETSLGIERLDDEAGIPALISRFREARCSQAKIYSSLPPRLIAPLARAAHAAGLTVTGHVPRGIGILPAVSAGMDMVSHVAFVGQAMLAPEFRAERRPEPPALQEAFSHLDPDSPRARQVAAELARRHVVVDPTLVVYEAPQHTPEENQRREPGLQYVPPVLRRLLLTFGPEPELLERDHRSWDVEVGLVRTLHRAGVPIVAGTDQGVPGHSLHRELEVYVEAGFTPMEALASATLVPARAMKLDREVGTLEAGKRADLIVVDGNPLQDIHRIRNVRMTMTRGRLYETAPLWKSVGFEPPR